MEDNYQRFIAVLLEIDPGLRSVQAEAVDYWSPEEPPVTTLLGELGDAITERFGDGQGVEETERDRRLFDHIERGMSEDDEALATVVATGLVEALTTVRRRSPELWKRVRSCMGDRSRAYADAWLASC